MSNDLTCSGSPGPVLTYASAVAVGSAIPAGLTALVTNDSTSITFSEAVSLPEGAPLVFASQPYQVPAAQGGAVLQNGNTFPTLPAPGSVLGPAQLPAVYYLAAAVVSGTVATLTEEYTGTGASATLVSSPPVLGTSKTYLTLGDMPVGSCNLAVTANVSNGSPAVAFSGDVTLPKGTLLNFSSDPESTYILAAAISVATAGTLTTPYLGPNDSAAIVENVTLVATLKFDVSPTLINNRGQRTTLLVQPFDDYADDQFVLFFPPGLNSTLEVVGLKGEPVTLFGIPANELGG